jgi:hypothetical protein
LVTITDFGLRSLLKVLKELRDLCERLEAMANDASKGIAPEWHVVLRDEPTG